MSEGSAIEIVGTVIAIGALIAFKFAVGELVYRVRLDKNCCGTRAGSKMTMARYAHVTAAQQRDAADLLD